MNELASPPVLFFALTLILAALPFVPAFVELKRKRDAKPLSVSHESATDIRHFARGYRELIERNLRGALEECSKQREQVEGFLGDGTPYLVIPGGAPRLSEAEERNRSARRMILSCDNMVLPDETMFLPELYSERSILGGKKCIYRAILAKENVEIEEGSMVLRWVHAGNQATVGEGSILYGRLSAENRVVIGAGCSFERLYAPRIEFAYPIEEPASVLESGKEHASGDREGREKVRMGPEDLGNLVDGSAGRWLCDGDLYVPANRLIEADLVATGRVVLGTGCVIMGSLKSHKELQLERGVRVEGSAVGGDIVVIEGECTISGPLVAERELRIGGGTVVGKPGKETTVNGWMVTVEEGVVIHGTVWAHQSGLVVSCKRSHRSVPGGGTE